MSTGVRRAAADAAPAVRLRVRAPERLGPIGAGKGS